jgi:hypothetical protein
MIRARGLALAACAALVLAGCGTEEEPTASPVPAAPAAAVTPVPSIDFADVSSGIAYTTRAFKPPITFTLPDGEWELGGGDSADHVELEIEAEDPVDDAGIGFHHMTQVFDPEKGGETPGDAVPGPNDFAAWLTEHPQLVASEPKDVMAMGLKGRSIDVTVKPGAEQERRYKDCGKLEGRACVVMFLGKIEPVVYGRDTKARYVVLEQDEDTQLVVEMWVEPRKAFDDQVKVFEEVVAGATAAGG